MLIISNTNYYFYLEELGFPACSHSELVPKLLVESQSVSLEWDQPDKSATCMGQHKHRIIVDGHRCFKWDLNPRTHYLSKCKYFML
jgi:hypothetical protein